MIVEHVFFDLDRTLWDFDQNSHDALSQLFDQLRLEEQIKNKRAFISDYKRINDQMWADYRKGLLPKDGLRVGRLLYALAKHGVEDKQIASRFAESYLALCPKLTRLFPETIETLTELKSKGKKLHIITNGFSEVQYIKLRKSGLEEFFDVVICSDSIGYNKPDQRIFKEALNKAKAKSEKSVMIGDHLEIDVLGANAAGIQGILFDPKNEYKGYLGVKKIKELSELKMLIF